jgi:hypothetical protein
MPTWIIILLVFLVDYSRMLTICYSHVVSACMASCNGHGMCVVGSTPGATASDPTSFCVCFRGYWGTNCEIRKYGYTFAVGGNAVGQSE